METKKESSSAPPTGQQSPPTGMNIPEWVMHLLTGLGTMGAEYMMFIKPLQEKMELQSKLIKEQGERIESLEALLAHKKSRIQLQPEQYNQAHEEKDEELFQVKRKPLPVSPYNKHARIKL